MPRTHVQLQSTALASYTYDTDSQTLDITFVNGRTYTHENVPEVVVQGLAAASSPGSYYASRIKGSY